MKKINVIKYFILPIVLLVLGFFASLVFNGYSISTISYVLPQNSIIENNNKILTKNDKIKIKFKAPDNFLGIIEVKFDKKNSINFKNDDQLFVELNDLQTGTLYYSNQYSADKFNINFKLPIGFPIVNDSKGKVYLLEIRSLAGDGVNSVKLSKNNPILLSVHQYPKSQIVSSPFNLINFILNKSFQSLGNNDFLMSSILYFLPLLFYLFWLLFLQKINIRYRSFSYLVLLLIILDSLILNEVNTGIILFLIGLWIISIYLYKFDYTVTVFINIILFLISIFIISLNIKLPHEKLSIYIYFMIIVSIIQYLYELKNKPRKTISYGILLKDFFKINEK